MTELIRIMCIGPRRLYEAMATLSFDYRISPSIDKTIIFTPYNRAEVKRALAEFNVECSKFEILSDDYFNGKYDLSRWTHDNWYKQQAFKLCALDYFDNERFLIQDADLLLTKKYEIFSEGKPVFKAEKIWNNHHEIYADCIGDIIGYRRKIDISLVNEFMPYLKQDWIELKTFIEKKYNKSWLNVIPDYRKFNSTKWFSEYELLGIWKTNRDNYSYNIWMSQPPISSWDDFYNTNWNLYGSVKFHTEPMKFMNKEQAKQVVKHINDTIN